MSKEHPIICSTPMVARLLDGSKTQTRRPVKWKGLDPGLNLSFSELSINYLIDDVHASGCRLCSRRGDGVWEDRSKQTFPRYQPGDVLWVREATYIAPPCFGEVRDCTHYDNEGKPRVVGYAASMHAGAVRCAKDYKIKLSPSIQMPRWAARIFLRVEDVRVERVQDITEADAIAEGLEIRMGDGTGEGPGYKWDGPGYWDGKSRSTWGKTYHAPGAYGVCSCKVGRVKNLTPARCAFMHLWDSFYGVGAWQRNDFVWVYKFSGVEDYKPSQGA